ncbi:MAG: PAS domain S-box protein [Oscillatoria princeps RMCB-10]|nr:PAS domain S-box protein [Oscillatoria princeps RMCB-10]
MVYQNITSDKQSEEQVRNALQKLTFHLENTPLAVIEWDGEFRVKRWYRGSETLFGWRAAEVTGLHPDEWSFVVPEDRPAVSGLIARLLSRLEQQNISRNRNRTKNGEVIHCQWHNSALLDETGNLVSVLSVVQDVTDRSTDATCRVSAEELRQSSTFGDETGLPVRMLGVGSEIAARKQAQEALQAANDELERRVEERTAELAAANASLKEQIAKAQLLDAERQLRLEQLESERGRLEAVLQQMPLGVTIAEAPSGRLIFANQQTEAIYRHPVSGEAPAGVKSANAAPANIEQYRDWPAYYLDGRQCEPENLPLARAMRTGEALTGIELKIQRGDGTWGILSVSAAPIRNRAGVTVAAAAFYDITERKQTEERLRLLESAVVDANDAIVITEAEPVSEPGARIIHVNDAFTRMTGLRTYQSRAVPELDQDGAIQYDLIVSRDITELKRAQEAIGGEKEFSERLINSSFDGIIAFDRECRYTVWNPAMEIISGMSKAEVLGICAFEVFPFLKEIGEDKYFQEVLQGKHAVASDRPYNIPQTGRQGFFEAYYSPLYSDSGEIVGGLGIIRDIAQRKKAEEERAQLLREQAIRAAAEKSERRFAFIAEASRVLASSLEYETTLASVAQLVVPEIADWCAVYVVESSGGLCQVAVAGTGTGSGCQLAERGAAQVVSTGTSQLHSEIPDSLLQEVARDAENLRELRMVELKSAMIVPVAARGQTLGAIAFVAAQSGRQYGQADLVLAEELASRAGLAIDSARAHRQAQEARQLAERAAHRVARLQAITSALSEALTPSQVAEVAVSQGIAALGACAGLMALLAEGDSALEVVRALGYPQEILETWRRLPVSLPVPLAETVRTGEPVFLESLEALISRVACARYPHHALIPSITGSRAFACVPLVVEGRPVGAIGLSFSDSREFSQEERALALALGQQCAGAIVRARLYEAERAARAEAEAANRMKDEFLAVLSHELRSPLNPMLGWVQMLLSRKLSEEKTRTALETIERNVRLQTQLIDDLLDVSRIIRGKLKLNPRFVELAGAIEAALNVVRQAAEAKGIHIETELDRHAGVVLADTNRLQQVVWNLLSNAIKFTPSGGRVTVRLEGAGDCVQLQVSDTGIGISPDFLPFVFDRFRQADSSTTRSYGGLGLGLAIVRHLVEQHGGTVSAASPGEGQGATFAVKLPVAESGVGRRASGVGEEPPVPFESAMPAAPLSGLRILVVDDEADTREFLHAALENGGGAVQVVASAGEAIEAIAQSHPDILVSDIAMPGEDGYWLIRKVRALESQGGRHILAVALTAYARASDVREALAAGFELHLPKPVDPAQLIAAIAKLAGRS